MPLPVEYRARTPTGPIEGRGLLRNISTSGALVEGSFVPSVGGALLMSFSLIYGGTPLRVPARVVRIIPEGFAVRFLETSPALEKVLAGTLPRAARKP